MISIIKGLIYSISFLEYYTCPNFPFKIRLQKYSDTFGVKAADVNICPLFTTKEVILFHDVNLTLGTLRVTLRRYSKVTLSLLDCEDEETLSLDEENSLFPNWDI